MSLLIQGGGTSAVSFMFLIKLQLGEHTSSTQPFLGLFATAQGPVGPHTAPRSPAPRSRGVAMGGSLGGFASKDWPWHPPGGGGRLAQGLGVGLLAAPTGLSPLCLGLES